MKFRATFGLSVLKQMYLFGFGLRGQFSVVGSSSSFGIPILLVLTNDRSIVNCTVQDQPEEVSELDITYNIRSTTWKYKPEHQTLRPACKACSSVHARSVPCTCVITLSPHIIQPMQYFEIAHRLLPFATRFTKHAQM